MDIIEYKLDDECKEKVYSLPGPKGIEQVYYVKNKFYILMDDLIQLKEDNKDVGQG